MPFSQYFTEDGTAPAISVGPTVPAAVRWLLNTVWMAVASMLLTCLTAAMAGYALAKKRFIGRGLIFTLIVCAMALPKQVILIPLIREMSSLKLYNTMSAVVYPIVGWPFGVFLMKQFAESIPGEILEAARIDGASELKTFNTIVFPMIKPGVGALAIFTFISSWNDYFMQLIMLSSNKNLTISLGIANMQAENSTDFGLIMAGAALAAVPIIIVFRDLPEVLHQGHHHGRGEGISAMILDKLTAAQAYRGIHPRLDRALELLTPEFLATVGTERQSIEGDASMSPALTLTPRRTRRALRVPPPLSGHLHRAGEERWISPPERPDARAAGRLLGLRGRGRAERDPHPGSFLVLFPGDAHRPGMAVDRAESISRIVFKILNKEN